jgi:hypothetical protein
LHWNYKSNISLSKKATQNCGWNWLESHGESFFFDEILGCFLGYHIMLVFFSFPTILNIYFVIWELIYILQIYTMRIYEFGGRGS